MYANNNDEATLAASGSDQACQPRTQALSRVWKEELSLGMKLYCIVMSLTSLPLLLVVPLPQASPKLHTIITW